MQNLVITNTGHELMTNLITKGTTASFNKIATSEHAYKKEELENLLSLEDIKQEVLISKSEQKDASTIEITAAITNEELTEGYCIKTLGLYIKDSEGNEILYAVAIDDTPDYVPAFDNKAISSIIYRLNVRVSNSEQVTLEVSPDAYATVIQMKEVDEDITKLDSKVSALESNLGDNKVVSTAANQGLTEEQKANARENIGAGESGFSGNYSDLKNIPAQFQPKTHTHTSSEVGLGNVPNVPTNDQTPTYSTSSSLAELTSGEKIGVAFGKIKKAISALITHLADTTAHITSAERTAWNSKSKVLVSQKLKSGTELGSVIIDGVETKLYFNSGGGGDTSFDAEVTELDANSRLGGSIGLVKSTNGSLPTDNEPYYLLIYTSGNSPYYCVQKAIKYDASHEYIRAFNTSTSTWTKWKDITSEGRVCADWNSGTSSSNNVYIPTVDTTADVVTEGGVKFGKTKLDSRLYIGSNNELMFNDNMVITQARLANNLTTTQAGYRALDAAQGKMLNDKLGKVLWTNTNPVAVDTMDIALGSDDYDVLDIYYSLHLESIYVACETTLKNYTVPLKHVYFSTGTNMPIVISRSLTCISSTKFSLSVVSAPSDYLDNTRLIPIKIVGRRLS